MLRVLTIVSAALVVTGCATSGITAADATPATSVVIPAGPPPANAGRLIVRRDSGFLGAACGHAVRLDGRLLGELSTKEEVVAYPAPGEHTVDVSLTGALCGAQRVAGKTFLIDAGQTRVFNSGFEGLQLVIVQVAEQRAAPAPAPAPPTPLSPMQAAATPSAPAAPAPTAPAPAARPSAPAAGQYAVEAERVGRQCSSQPRASLAAKGPGYETYSVTCDGGDSLMVRCEFGNCRALR